MRLINNFIKALLISLLICEVFSPVLLSQGLYKYPFQEPSLNIEERVNDIVSRLTLDEKIGQMMNAAPAIDHLGIPAIIHTWYPGQAGGKALADVIFGDYNPAGRLPVTVYKSINDLPPFEDYSMKNRTYRYFTGEPLYRFGCGLSYTTFAYSNLQVKKNYRAGEPVEVSVNVKNTGKREGEEGVLHCMELKRMNWVF